MEMMNFIPFLVTFFIFLTLSDHPLPFSKDGTEGEKTKMRVKPIGILQNHYNPSRNNNNNNKKSNSMVDPGCIFPFNASICRHPSRKADISVFFW